MSENCIGCGQPLPEPVMCSISHTIKAGARLCPGCGLRESTDPAWAEGMRIAQIRLQAALGVPKKFKKLFPKEFKKDKNVKV